LVVIEVPPVIRKPVPVVTAVVEIARPVPVVRDGAMICEALVVVILPVFVR
jgi:hypothetical protein